MHAYSAAGQIRANKKKEYRVIHEDETKTHTSRYRTCGQDNLYPGTRVQNRVFANREGDAAGSVLRASYKCTTAR